MIKKIFLGILALFALFVLALWYTSKHPIELDISHLPAGKPLLVLKFQHGDPDNLKFLSVRLIYAATAGDEAGVKTHESCSGRAWPRTCYDIADELEQQALVYIDRVRGEALVPFDVRLDRPGKYELFSIALSNPNVDNGTFVPDTLHVTGERHGDLIPTGFARHADPAWNLVLRTRGANLNVFIEQQGVLPYFPTSAGRRAALAETIRAGADDVAGLPDAYVNARGGVVSASSGSLVLDARLHCASDAQEDLTAPFQALAQFKRIKSAQVAVDRSSGKRCRILKTDQGSVELNSVKDQVFIRQASGAERIEALWVKDSLVYALADGRAGLRFIDAALLKLYPDSEAEFPMAGLATLKLQADSALTIKLARTLPAK